MKITNHTLYDTNLIIRYNKAYLNLFLKKNFFIMSIIVVAMATYMAVIEEWLYSVVLIGILLFYLGFSFVIHHLITKKILKKSPLVDHPIMQTYVFEEDNFQIINIKSQRVKYQEIVKARKTIRFYILTDVFKKTYIIDRTGFESPEQDLQMDVFFSTKFTNRIYK